MNENRVGVLLQALEGYLNATGQTFAMLKMELRLPPSAEEALASVTELFPDDDQSDPGKNLDTPVSGGHNEKPPEPEGGDGP